jgi:MFS-type transporter involved in bile tolerance (Atg22 family)
MGEALGNAFRLSSDRHRHGQDAFSSSPFSRLMITHVLSLAGDALVTLALAGSLFFSTPLHAARGRVALTLLLTMAPFAVVAPLLGPIIDRFQGGRRAMVVATAIGRALACFLMARFINSFLLFPAAFLTLVCSKGYTVAKATLVPSAVERPEDLVEANSKLAVSGALAGFLIAIPGVAILKLANAAWVLRLDILVLLACAASALRLQVTERLVAAPPPRSGDTAVIVDEGEFPSSGARQEVRAKPLPAGAIQVAAFAMGTMRLIVGFMTFLVAFGFRNDHAPAWWFGIVLAASIGGNLVGAAVAPWLRSRLREELILAGSAVTIAAAGVLALLFNPDHSRPAATLLAGVVGLASGAAKLSFDALVQRHIPAASQGRAFGRFEAGFQLVWVLGGLLPVVIEMSLPAGFAFITVAAAVAAVAYIVGTRLARLGQLPPWWPGVRPPSPRGPRPPAPASSAAGATTVSFAAPLPEGATVPLATPAHAPPYDDNPGPYDDMPWMDPPPDLGTYPPAITGPPPLGQSGRPVPPPLAGPPPRAAPLAARPPRDQPEE